MLRHLRRTAVDPARVDAAVAALELPDAVFRSCPWEPWALVAEGLRQWLRCAGAAMRDDQVIGMPSHAVDEAWHGLILCTSRYATFCEAAYGRFLHHHPEGAGPPMDMDAALDRTVVAWALARRPGEEPVLFDLDERLGVEPRWGIPRDRVDAVLAQVAQA